MPKPCPQEFRDDVVKVARSRPDGVTLEQIAADFGIHPMTLSGWMRKAAIEFGERPGLTTAESAELGEARKRIRLLEQENDVLGLAHRDNLRLELRGELPARPPGTLTR
jgi:transposase